MFSIPQPIFRAPAAAAVPAVALSMAAQGDPHITAVLNNSSLIPAGYPSSGIAPSSIFVITGTANQVQSTLSAGGLDIALAIGDVSFSHPATYK